MEESSHQPSDGSNKHPSNLSQLLSNKSNKRRSSFRCTFWHFGVTARLCYLLLALLFNSAPCQAGDGIIISQSDYLGLEAFKYALDDPKGFLRSWNDTGLGACSGAWAGINCVKGKVIAIHLPWRGLGGHVARKIGQLTALRKLSLHDNSIGGPIPSSIQFLPRLTGLYLFNNRFSGSIPPSIGNCLMLRTLDLSNNSLVGRIPSFIANSTRLYRLDLSHNSLSGTIPAGVTRSPSLTLLSLQHNNLSGSIPDTWGVTRNRTEVFQLQTLYLDHNSITGNIPASFSRLRMLKEISLSNNQLGGSIPEEIGMLPLLQTFDVSGNSIGGGFPGSLSNLASLVRLDLASNHLESQIPETIDGLKNLSVLSLRRNRLHGEIPAGLGNIPSLSQLDLSDNHLTGAIPESLGHLTNLTSFFVSNNNLKGAVPFLLSEKFNSSSFSGNIQLCGYSVSVPCPPSPPPTFPPTSSPLKPGQQKLSSKDIILIGAGGVLALLLLLCCILLCCLIGIRTATGAATRDEKPVTASAIEVGSREDTDGKLVHFDGRLAFTAEDLLCAMAEIMGKSTYGTVYKTTLEGGNQVAVKRLREKLAKSQREFEKEVNVLGKIRHTNLLALRAYYLGPKGEKLLVFDFMPKGSLATFLHARGPDIRIDWPTRMNMAKGVTRGLCYLHHDMNMIHGSLTSSNVLLDDEEDTNVKIADYGLSCLMTAATDSNEIATAGAVGYRAPELSKLKNANTKTDVYSLGVIILELLTGKSPGELVDGMDLPHWVASIVEEEWPNEVFDLELMRDTTVMMGDELLNTLKLALHCVDPSPVARPEAQQVLQQLEEIKPDIAAGSEGSANDGGSAALMINQK